MRQSIILLGSIKKKEVAREVEAQAKGYLARDDAELPQGAVQLRVRRYFSRPAPARGRPPIASHSPHTCNPSGAAILRETEQGLQAGGWLKRGQVFDERVEKYWTKGMPYMEILCMWKKGVVE